MSRLIDRRRRQERRERREPAGTPTRAGPLTRGTTFAVAAARREAAKSIPQLSRHREETAAPASKAAGAAVLSGSRPIPKDRTETKTRASSRADEKGPNLRDKVCKDRPASTKRTGRGSRSFVPWCS